MTPAWTVTVPFSSCTWIGKSGATLTGYVGFSILHSQQIAEWSGMESASCCKLSWSITLSNA